MKFGEQSGAGYMPYLILHHSMLVAHVLKKHKGCMHWQNLLCTCCCAVRPALDVIPHVPQSHSFLAYLSAVTEGFTVMMYMQISMSMKDTYVTSHKRSSSFKHDTYAKHVRPTWWDNDLWHDAEEPDDLEVESTFSKSSGTLSEASSSGSLPISPSVSASTPKGGAEKDEHPTGRPQESIRMTRMEMLLLKWSEEDVEPRGPLPVPAHPGTRSINRIPTHVPDDRVVVDRKAGPPSPPIPNPPHFAAKFSLTYSPNITRRTIPEETDHDLLMLEIEAAIERGEYIELEDARTFGHYCRSLIARFTCFKAPAVIVDDFRRS